MEKIGYRDNLERLNVVFPDKEILKISDVARFSGLSRQTVAKKFPFKGSYISKATLARELS
jgi:hypothetical protein